MLTWAHTRTHPCLREPTHLTWQFLLLPLLQYAALAAPGFAEQLATNIRRNFTICELTGCLLLCLYCLPGRRLHLALPSWLAAAACCLKASHPRCPALLADNRAPEYNITRAAITLLVGFAFGSMFWRLGDDRCAGRDQGLVGGLRLYRWLEREQCCTYLR